MQSTRWYELEGSEQAGLVTEIVESLDGDYGGRDARAARSLSMYEGRTLSSASPAAYLDEWRDDGDLVINVIRSACDQVQADIAGKQKPKPMFVTSGADYRTRRRAKKLDKFVESQLGQPQGSYADAWEMMAECLRDAEIFGTGLIKVYPDGDSIALDRLRLNQLRLDPYEAAPGNPRNWFLSGAIDRQTALEMFAEDPDDEEDDIVHAINSAPPYVEDKHESGFRVDPPVRYIEAWCLPVSGSDKPGVHVIVINGCIMHSEEWEHDCVPIVVVRWAREINSFWGKSLVEEGESLSNELNANAAKLQERFALCGAKRTYYHKGSVDPKALEGNDAETLIEVNPGAQFPVDAAPNPVSASEVNWMQSMRQMFFDTIGVSQMSASARKEQGVTAAVALRTLNDMGTARMSIKARQYEQAFVTLGRLIVMTARMVAAENSDYKLPWPGSSYHDKISWQNADLADDMYEIHVAPASALPNDPAGRMQTVQELFQAGVISTQTYKRLLDMPDLEDEMRAEGAERDRIEWEIDRMLDAEEDDEFEFHPPDGYLLDPQGAMVLVGGEYHQAMREGAPEYNLSLLRAYMSNLDKIIARATQPQPAAGGMPPAPLALPAGAPPPQAAAPNPPVMQ